MDAIIYFRNTITPVCTFAIGLIAAMLYGARINRLLLIIGAIALFYGYCEFFFQLDFLALFHGDDYTAMRFVDRLETRQLVNSLQDPGVRYPGLQELMTVPLFNLTVLDDYLPRVFRLSGPNFHPISYAYAIAIIASWFVMQRRWAFLIIALPLLFVVGSKGATVIVLATVFFRGALFFLRPRAAIASLVGILVLYITAAIVIGHVKADYHVLGFFAGIRDFIGNPLGQGLGIGGNLSSSLDGVHDWQEAQHQGIANIPLESAVGVMLYQMGPGALALFCLADRHRPEKCQNRQNDKSTVALFRCDGGSHDHGQCRPSGRSHLFATRARARAVAGRHNHGTLAARRRRVRSARQALAFVSPKICAKT